MKSCYAAGISLSLDSLVDTIFVKIIIIWDKTVSVLPAPKFLYDPISVTSLATSLVSNSLTFIVSKH